jgi:hypothetical protein
VILAAVPFGMTSADFKQLAATVAIAACAAFVVVVLVMCLRDVLVARYAAKAREEERERPVRPRGRQRVSGTSVPMATPVTNVHRSQVPPPDLSGGPIVSQVSRPVRPPAADPTVWPEPSMVKGARLRTPSPASDLPEPPPGTGGIAPPRRTTEHRVSGMAADRGDRTRLDLTPTEEK